jgi:nicotinate-nucleotide adenylyltransferase
MWWLVTPGNPLKRHDDLANLAQRMDAARTLARDPRFDVLSVEADIGVSRTLDTLRWLRRRAPHIHFVWVMGADNLAGFHRWHGWREIAATLPLCVVDRPGFTLKALASPAARMLASQRLDQHDAALLAQCPAPAWVFLRAPLKALSSSLLRAGAGAPQ